jgi:hypothetical protein
MNDPVLLYAASAALACVLLLGALEKLKDVAGFAAAVSGYRILPAGWELALLVLAAATLALAFNLLRGHRDIDCGCGGPASAGPGRRGGGLSWWLVLRNAVLALWTAPALLAAAEGSRGLQWADAAAVFGLAMSAVGLYFTVNHLLASHLKLRNL